MYLLVLFLITNILQITAQPPAYFGHYCDHLHGVVLKSIYYIERQNTLQI